MLEADNTALLVVDIQEKLSRTMHAREELIANARRLIQGARVLGVPVILTEQNPKGLGPTVAEVRELLPEVTAISKFSFSCCTSAECQQALKQLDRGCVLIAGIETHICVFQTAADLVTAGVHAEVVADACSSRTPGNKLIGLDKCRAAGAVVTSVETALFELLKAAEGPLFKEILSIVK
jgi:nicotinamidase-related amidase